MGRFLGGTETAGAAIIRDEVMATFRAAADRDGLEVLKPDAMREVRQAAATITINPHLAKAFTGGVPEVSRRRRTSLTPQHDELHLKRGVLGMIKDTATSRERNIDILRGVSILAVLAYHFHWFQPVSDRGIYGVLLFFLISGYCMEISLRASSGALEFLARRQSRLVPALIVCAVITHLVETSFPDIRPDRLQTWLDVAKNALCIPTIDLPCGAANRLAEGAGSYTMVDGAYWSLRIEFGFYAMLLLLHYAITKRFHLLALLAVAIGGGIWLYMFGGTKQMREFVPYLPYFATGSAIFEIRTGMRATAGRH